MNTAADEAAQWLCELREGNTGTRAEFVAWLKDSPRNVREFLLVSAATRALDGVGPRDEAGLQRLIAEALENREDNVVRMRDDVTDIFVAPPASRMPRAWKRIVGVAAAVAVVGAGLWALPFLTGTKTYSTDLGEQRALTLSDGSSIHLNTGSRVRVRFSDRERSLELVKGEALFVVAQDHARPFRVHSGSSVIQALGTRFNVYRRTEGTRVSVLEGAVKVSGDDAPVSAGEQVQIELNGQVVREKPVDVSEAIAWREQRLVFRAQRLEDIAAEFNRYNLTRIRVEGDTARNRLLTGTGAATSPESLIQFLAQYGDLSVERRENEIVIRGR